MSSKFLILLLNLGKFLSGIFGFQILAVTDKISVCAVKVQCLAHTGVLVNFPCGFLSKMKKKSTTSHIYHYRVCNQDYDVLILVFAKYW